MKMTSFRCYDFLGRPRFLLYRTSIFLSYVTLWSLVLPRATDGNYNLVLHSEVHRLLGLSSDIYLVREGVVNEYALKYVVNVPSQIETLYFSWQSLIKKPPFLNQRPAGVSDADFLAQIPFQLLSTPQFGNIAALIANISQSFNKPQPGVDGSTTKQPRILIPSNPAAPNNEFATLPFENLNTNELSWIYNLLENSTSSTSNGKENTLGLRQQRPPPPNTILADLNFLTWPQLLNIFGR